MPALTFEQEKDSAEKAYSVEMQKADHVLTELKGKRVENVTFTATCSPIPSDLAEYIKTLYFQTSLELRLHN